jgi:peptide/nickel transport system substrate-binding protein
MKLTATAVGLCVTASLLAGCGASDSSEGAGGAGGGDDAAKVVDGGTFTMALASDPGNLDPQMAAGSALFTLTQLAYDSLLSVNAESGAIESQLASDWKVDGTTVTFTLADGVTCADGSDLTASDVADNIAFVGDPKNESPFLGTFLPIGATAKADDAAGTVTLKLAAPAPFVLNGMASLPIVCPSGMDDRKSLSQATAGTGPYELTEAAPGEQYTYQIRDGYTWGPAGATTATEGMPDTIVMKIVQNETTSANLLLSGDLNAAQIIGPDAERLDKAGLFSAETPALLGEQWYNHAKGRAASVPEVRMALTQALDLSELQNVLTSGKGTPATTLTTLEPTACPGDSVSGSVPAMDTDAAKAILDKAGPLDLTFLYSTGGGSGVAAAAELAVQQWEALGIKVTAKGQDDTALQGTIFGAGDWDIAWVPLNVNSPDQVVPFLSGPAAPDGTNFSDIQNADYDAAVKEASAMTGEDGCATWLQAESALFAAADIVPFANSVVQTFGAKAEFETPGQLIPTSIRMLAE